MDAASEARKLIAEIEFFANLREAEWSFHQAGPRALLSLRQPLADAGITPQTIGAGMIRISRGGRLLVSDGMGGNWIEVPLGWWQRRRLREVFAQVTSRAAFHAVVQARRREITRLNPTAAPA